MKRGRKPQESTKKIEQIIQQMWNAQTLDMKIIEDFNLFNEYFPPSKQIFVKQQLQTTKRNTKIRCVKKLNENAPLIDCRTKKVEPPKEIPLIQQNQIEEENNQLKQQVIEIEENPNNVVIVISSDESVICLNDEEGFNLENEISDHEDQWSKTQPQPRIQVAQNTRQQSKIPRYLQYEPSNSSSSSINFSQPLSASLIARFMNDENEVIGQFDEWSLSSLESKTPPIKNNQHQNTYTQFQKYFPQITNFQFESILQAYNHDYETILRVLQNDKKQIRMLLEKNKRRKF